MHSTINVFVSSVVVCRGADARETIRQLSMSTEHFVSVIVEDNEGDMELTTISEVLYQVNWIQTRNPGPGTYKINDLKAEAQELYNMIVRDPVISDGVIQGKVMCMQEFKIGLMPIEMQHGSVRPVVTKE